MKFEGIRDKKIRSVLSGGEPVAALYRGATSEQQNGRLARGLFSGIIQFDRKMIDLRSARMATNVTGTFQTHARPHASRF
jgi:hypothetical protein